MYNYIKRTNDYTLNIQVDNRIIYQDIPIQTHFNKLLKKQLTNLIARENTCKKVFNFKAKVPIYINQNILLMCIKSYRSINCLYINYHSIISYSRNKKEVIINFRDNHSMKINDSFTFLNQLKKCERIISHINQESVFSIWILSDLGGKKTVFLV